MMFFASAALLLLPFDLIGGIWIPASLENQTLKPSVWLRR